MNLMRLKTCAVLSFAGLAACGPLGGCAEWNSAISGGLAEVNTNAKAAIANVTTANVAAVELWKTAACGLTVGGLAGSGDTVAIKAAMQACPIPGTGTVTVNDNGSISVQTAGAATVAPKTTAP